MSLSEKYGKLALIAGASKGIGASFSKLLAKNGFDLVLVARNKEDLKKQASLLQSEFNVEVQTISCDLANQNTTQQILESLNGKAIDLLVYNAAQSHIGSFEGNG